MKWQTKAKIMKACALLPEEIGIYRSIQKIFGRLNSNPMSRIINQVEMAQWILAIGRKVAGKTFLEVGTGHNLIVPIGLFLTGAKKVITVDIHRRLDFGILKKSLVWMAKNRDTLASHYAGVTEKAHFDERFYLIDRLADKPEKFLAETNIQYLAPVDATNTELQDASLDYHISNTVFEHIPKEILEGILFEAKRVLESDGMALHFIDLSDHFQHQDKRINRINFLRYSETEWNQIGGNQFAYCNRMRASDYLALFKRCRFDIRSIETKEDEEASQNPKDGFVVDSMFRNKSIDDLCTTQLRIALMINSELETHS